VEVGSSARHCPLCHAAIVAGESSPPPHHAYPEHILDPEDGDTLTPREKRTVFLELFTACSLIAAIVVLAINALVDGRLTWSLYPLASFAYLWLAVGIPVILSGRPWLIFSVIGPSSLAFLLALDAIDGSLEWFPTLGLPLALILEGIVVGCGALSAASKRKGINIIAIVLAGVVLACVGLETVLNLNFQRRLFLSWSAIVMIAGLPSAGFLFYVHYRIVNRASLRKLFHL
jgi:predicted nucleic acid-binding Zn ribbon protein